MTSDDPTPPPDGYSYEERYSDEQLDLIIDQGMIYMCACPAQVASAIRTLRALVKYQIRCAADTINNSAVHAVIAKSSIASHTIMQDCLDVVIDLEKWDRTTLKMPEGMRKRQNQAFDEQ